MTEPSTWGPLGPPCACSSCRAHAERWNQDPGPRLRVRIAQAMAAHPSLGGLYSDHPDSYLNPHSDVPDGYVTEADAVLAVVEAEIDRVARARDGEVERLTAEVEGLRQELGTIRGELADFAQESVPSHVSTLQAVRWLIAEHDEQVKHNEEVGEENRALCDERDELAATVNRLRAGNAEYAKVFATWQSLWDEKEEWEKAAKEAWQRENVGSWLVAESRWLLRGMARRVGDWRRTSAGHYADFYHAAQERQRDDEQLVAENRRLTSERDEALAALKQQQDMLAEVQAGLPSLGACSCKPTLVVLHESGSYCGDPQYEAIHELLDAELTSANLAGEDGRAYGAASRAGDLVLKLLDVLRGREEPKLETPVTEVRLDGLVPDENLERLRAILRGDEPGPGVGLPPRKLRLRECVERWPECETGDFNPSCCRFPSSCSATVYDENAVKPEDLEERRG